MLTTKRKDGPENVEAKMSLIKETIGIATALQVYNGMELPEKPTVFLAKRMPGKVGRFVSSMEEMYAAHREIITELQQAYHSHTNSSKDNNGLLDTMLIATGLNSTPALGLKELGMRYLSGMTERLEKEKLFQYLEASDEIASLLQKKAVQHLGRLGVVKLSQATEFTGLDAVAVQLYDQFISSLPKDEDDIAHSIAPYQQALAQILSEQYLRQEETMDKRGESEQA